MPSFMKRLVQAGKALLQRVGDKISELTQYVAVPVPLQRASGPKEMTLDLPGYRQIDSYSCGAIAGAMVVRYLRPTISFERIYRAIDPRKVTGAGYGRVMRGLRSLGVGVTWRKDLNFAAICQAIDAGRPVIACMKTIHDDIDHWTVIYGYGRRPNLVFVAGRGMHFMPVQRMKWPEFRKQWTPPGEGLVCWKADTRKTTSRTVKKK